MRCDPQQLERQLIQSQQALPHVFLVAGPEMLLREECVTAIRQQLKLQGVTEREIIEAEKGFNWDQLASAGAAMSLFGDSRLIELRLSSGKIGRDGGAAVQEWIAADQTDYLLITCEQWDLSTEKTSWAKAVDKQGWYIPVWAIKPERLISWLRQRLQQKGLNPSNDAVALLSSRVEGNLLAAAQEVDKLALILPPGPLSLEAVEAAVADSAQYDVFRLTEAVLKGATAEALRMAKGLLRAGEAPPLIVGLLCREFQLLVQWMHDAPRQGVDAAFRQLGIWRNRQGPMQQAARRLGSVTAARALAALGELDKMAKGQSRGHFQTALEQFILSVTQDNRIDPIQAVEH